mgnify:CR=1 FL=1
MSNTYFSTNLFRPRSSASYKKSSISISISDWLLGVRKDDGDDDDDDDDDDDEEKAPVLVSPAR